MTSRIDIAFICTEEASIYCMLGYTYSGERQTPHLTRYLTSLATMKPQQTSFSVAGTTEMTDTQILILYIWYKNGVIPIHTESGITLSGIIIITKEFKKRELNKT